MTKTTTRRPKKCRICSESFVPTRAIQPVCCEYKCMVAYAEKVAAKSAARRKVAERQITLARRESLKTFNDYVREVDTAFSAFIRYRDRDMPCICCGLALSMNGDLTHGGHCDAGHFISRKHMATRWDEDNVHAQRKHCNRYLAGNHSGFRAGLIKRIGLERVQRLETLQREVRKFNIYELLDLRDYFKAQLRELKALERKAAWHE